MVKSIYLKISGLMAVLMLIALPLHFATADMVKGAANGCFPRVFAQINQFKVSSGGLLNTNANPRSIICSLDLNAYADSTGTDTNDGSVSVFVDTDELTGNMECTLYARDARDGSLIDSVTTTKLAGAFGTMFFGRVNNSGAINSYYFVPYLQCKVPGGTRIYQYDYFHTSAP